MIDDIEDLLGPIQTIAPPAPRRKPGPAPKPKPEAPADTFEFEDDHPDVRTVLDGGFPDPSAFIRPVGVSFIGTVLGIEPRRLHKRLKNCPVVGRGTNGRGKGQPLYDFKEAMRYCLEPKMDIKTLFSSMSTTTMPPIIMKAFWEGIRAKNKVMEETGHYWHDADVLAILGEVQMEIKDATLLWIEDLPGKANLSTEDYHALRRKVDELLATIQARVTEMVADRHTPSVVAEIEADIEQGRLSLHGGGE